MNNICKQYLNQVKLLFPFIGKQERNYLQNLSLQLSEFCEENPVSSAEDLYKHFDRPEDVVAQYLSSMETTEIIQQIRRTRLLRASIICLIIITISVSTFFIAKTVMYHKAYEETLSSINGYWIDTIE